jgi:hypothetical protein
MFTLPANAKKKLAEIIDVAAVGLVAKGSRSADKVPTALTIMAFFRLIQANESQPPKNPPTLATNGGIQT